MNLPTDFTFENLSELAAWYDEQGERATSLSMTEEQYCKYKELVYKADPIRFFRGARIVVTKPVERKWLVNTP